MKLTYDPKEFYRAHLARDPRFDGKFFVAVKTTGIYCRSICPARKAKLHNLTFYLTAAEAIAAGYRPCLRCRPETAPGSTAWLGTTAIVQRAIRLMDVHALEELSIAALAHKLNISERWLRELFRQQVGTNPQSLLLTKKLDLARNLLDTSNISITDVAFSSGFQSLRRFNDAFKKQFQQAPSVFRNVVRSSGYLGLQLSYRPPYAWHSMLHYLQQRAIPDMELVDETSYQRLFTYGVIRGWFKVRQGANNKLEIEVKTSKNINILEFVTRLKNIFDLDAEPTAISNVLAEDRKLQAFLAEHQGLRVPGCWDGFELAVRAVVGQRISVKAAHSILTNLVERHGEQQTLDPTLLLTQYFPTPENILAADLTNVGLPASRVVTIKTLAQLIIDKKLNLDGTADYQETYQQLLAIKGVGPWTAEYIAMRALKNPDAFPETDLEIQKRLKRLELDPKKWSPWRAYGAILLLNINMDKNYDAKDK